MNLTAHISYLLKYHECVVIPEFGAFISNYKPAQYNLAKNTFLPPSKEVVFNAKIKKNDGLLINYLVETENIAYHQAEVSIMNFVDSLFARLNNGEKVELEQLGVFEFDKTGAIVYNTANKFEMIEAYGLSEFSYPPMLENHASFQARPAIRVLNNRRDIVKIAASIALLLSLSLVPIKNERVNLHSSTVVPTELLREELPVQQEVENPVETIKEETAEVAENPFILVGGCFQQFENASQLQTELVGEGYNSEIVEMETGLYRVIVDSYLTSEEAQNAKTTYHRNHNGSGVWVSTR